MKEEDLKKCCEICRNKNDNCEHKDFALQYNFIVCPFYSIKTGKNIVIIPEGHQKKWWLHLKSEDKGDA